MEKRRRFPLEVFEACRQAWPRDKALGMRLSCVEWVEGGLTIEDTIETARQLKALGCDFIDASSGGNAAHQKIPVAPGYQVPFAARIRKEAGHQDVGGRRHHRARAGRAHRRLGRGRLHRPCARLPARSALGLERGPRARRRTAVPAAAGGARQHHPALQAAAGLGQGGRLGPRWRGTSGACHEHPVAAAHGGASSPPDSSSPSSSPRSSSPWESI